MPCSTAPDSHGNSDWAVTMLAAHPSQQGRGAGARLRRTLQAGLVAPRAGGRGRGRLKTQAAGSVSVYARARAVLR